MPITIFDADFSAATPTSVGGAGSTTGASNPVVTGTASGSLVIKDWTGGIAFVDANSTSDGKVGLVIQSNVGSNSYPGVVEFLGYAPVLNQILTIELPAETSATLDHAIFMRYNRDTGDGFYLNVSSSNIAFGHIITNQTDVGTVNGTAVVVGPDMHNHPIRVEVRLITDRTGSFTYGVASVWDITTPSTPTVLSDHKVIYDIAVQGNYPSQGNPAFQRAGTIALSQWTGSSKPNGGNYRRIKLESNDVRAECYPSSAPISSTATVTLAGIGTAWTGGTTFSIASPNNGCAITSTTFNSANSVTLGITTSTTTGPITIVGSDGTTAIWRVVASATPAPSTLVVRDVSQGGTVSFEVRNDNQGNAGPGVTYRTHVLTSPGQTPDGTTAIAGYSVLPVFSYTIPDALPRWFVLECKDGGGTSRLSPLAQAIKPAGKAVPVISVGDSTTSTLGYALGEVLRGNMKNRKIAYHNHGVNGSILWRDWQPGLVSRFYGSTTSYNNYSIIIARALYYESMSGEFGPPIVQIQLGTNDAWSAPSDGTTWAANMVSLLSSIVAATTTTTVLVDEIPPICQPLPVGNTWYGAATNNINTYNSLLDSVISSVGSSRVRRGASLYTRLLNESIAYSAASTTIDGYPVPSELGFFDATGPHFTQPVSSKDVGGIAVIAAAKATAIVDLIEGARGSVGGGGAPIIGSSIVRPTRRHI